MGNSSNKAATIDNLAKTRAEEAFLDLCKVPVDEAQVRSALETRPELVQCSDTRRFFEGFTPLHHACANGREEVARLLLKHGADVAARRNDGWTPLHVAALSGHEVMVRLLLEHGAEVDAQNDGWTPLQHAAARGHEKVARLLLERGAKVDPQDKYDDWTPLHRASNAGHEKVARLLLEHGADRGVQSSKGETARDVAQRNDEAAVVTLLDSYFPITPQMTQVLLALNGRSESALARFARHPTFEPEVVGLIQCLLTGQPNPAFTQLAQE